MPNNPVRPQPPRAGSVVAWAVLLLLGLTAAALLSSNKAAAQTPVTTTPSQAPAGSMIVKLTGTATLTLDKRLTKQLSKAKVTLAASSGAKRRGSKITFPIATETAVTPETADIPFRGRLQLKAKGGKKLVVRDLTLRLRSTGADLGGAVGKAPLPQFSALTTGAKTDIKQDDAGYHYRNMQALISADFVAAGKKAKIGGLTAGTNLGLLTAEITVQ